MTNPEQQIVTISLNDYIDLLNKEQKLELLYYGGLDSWDWYDDSLEDFDEITVENFTSSGAANDSRVQCAPYSK